MKSMKLKKSVSVAVVIVFCTVLFKINNRFNVTYVDPNAFGNWSITEELFDYIRKEVPEGSKILELGSGWGSGQLSKHYTVYSIEHDEKWVNKFDTHYIYAPIKDGWYNAEIVKQELPQEYALILIDGPPAAIGRGGFYTHLDLFNTNCTMIFDDVSRQADYNLMVNVAEKLGKSFEIVVVSETKQFGIISATT